MMANFPAWPEDSMTDLYRFYAESQPKITYESTTTTDTTTSAIEEIFKTQLPEQYKIYKKTWILPWYAKIARTNNNTIPTAINQTLMSQTKDGSLKSYIIEKIKNPDPGSEFDIMTQQLRNQYPQDQRIPILATQGYDTMAYTDSNNTPIGLIAFQVKGDAMHIFRFELEKKYRNKWLTVSMHDEILKSNYITDKGIKKVKIGKTATEAAQENKASVKLLQKLREKGYNVSLEEHIIYV